MDVGHNVTLQCMHRHSTLRLLADYTVVKVNHTRLTPHDLSNLDGRIRCVQASRITVVNTGSHIQVSAFPFLYSNKIIVLC